MKRLYERGDTIVEVLIAIAIISTVLVAAYQTTTRSVLATQSTQEHSQALKYAETQMEYLRAAHTFNPATDDCFGEGGVPTSVASDCVITPNGPGTDPEFTVMLEKDAVEDVYVVTVKWAGLSNIQESVSLRYRPQGVAP